MSDNKIRVWEDIRDGDGLRLIGDLDGGEVLAPSIHPTTGVRVETVRLPIDHPMSKVFVAAFDAVPDRRHVVTFDREVGASRWAGNLQQWMALQEEGRRFLEVKFTDGNCVKNIFEKGE